MAAAQFCHFCLWVVAFPSQHFYLSRLDNALWFFSFYFWLAHLGWIVSRLAVLAACQHKPANLVQNLIISLLFSTRLNSTTIQVCQKCCSASVSSVHRGMDFSDWRIPLPPFCSFFCACMCTCKGGAGGRNSCPKRQTSISLPKLETYLNLLAGNQLKGWFPTHAQGRVSSSAEFLKSPHSLLHRVCHFRRKTQLSVVCVRLHRFRLEKSVLIVCIISCPDKISTKVDSLVISEIKYMKRTLFF